MVINSVFSLNSIYFSSEIKSKSQERIRKLMTSILVLYAILINLDLSLLVFLETPSAILAVILVQARLI